MRKNLLKFLLNNNWYIEKTPPNARNKAISLISPNSAPRRSNSMSMNKFREYFKQYDIKKKTVPTKAAESILFLSCFSLLQKRYIKKDKTDRIGAVILNPSNPFKSEERVEEIVNKMNEAEIKSILNPL